MTDREPTPAEVEAYLNAQAEIEAMSDPDNGYWEPTEGDRQAELIDDMRREMRQECA